jgi:hypothetical protein
MLCLIVTSQVISTVQHILRKGLDGVNFDYEASPEYMLCIQAQKLAACHNTLA